MNVQSILFDRESFTEKSAESWARSHGFRSKIDSSKPKLRARQASPKKFDKSTFRTKAIRPGVKIVVAQKKGAKQSRKKKFSSQPEQWRRVWRVGKAEFFVESHAKTRARRTGSPITPGWKPVKSGRRAPKNR